jgi:hypothetical protein
LKIAARQTDQPVAAAAPADGCLPCLRILNMMFNMMSEVHPDKAHAANINNAV